VLVLSLFGVLLLTGCGRSASTTTTTTARGGLAFTPATPHDAALCLNQDQFLVEEATTTVAGSSPEGVNFTVRFYRSTSAANAAAVRANRRYTARFGRVVVNFAGNPPAHPGQAPRVLKHVDLVTIRHCVLRLASVPAGAG
jgi:hypothetical protein